MRADIVNLQSLTAYHLQMPLKFTFKTSQGSVSMRDTIILRAQTMDGYVGYGECVAFTEPFYTDETVAACWNKLMDDYMFAIRLMRPQSVRAFLRQLRSWLARDAMPMTVACLENALLHAVCQRMGTNTVSFVMGQELMPVIPNGVVIGDVSMDSLPDIIAAHVVQGCKRIKLKVNAVDGYERTKLVRHAFPDIQLAVDANQSYGPDQIDAVRQYNDLHVMCIEEPFTIADLPSYRAWREDVKRQGDWGISTPVCLDESVTGTDDVYYAIEHDLFDVLNVKVGRFGGLMGTRGAIMGCRGALKPYWIGSMVESGVSKILHVQLAALGDSYMAGDLSDSSRYFEEDLIQPPVAFHDGITAVPRGPGIGVDVSDEIIERYCVEKRTL